MLRTRGKDLHQCLFLWRLVEKPSESVSTQSQHQRIQQRSETRGCHSRPTHLGQIGTTMTGFDASGAFMSVHHTTLDKLLQASFEDEMDRSLMKQRYRGAQIPLCANSDEPRVEIVLSCGFYRETLRTLLFLSTFTVNKLRSGKDTERRRILTRNICMRSASLQVTSTTHHPPFLLTTSRNELSRTLLQK